MIRGLNFVDVLYVEYKKYSEKNNRFYLGHQNTSALNFGLALVCHWRGFFYHYSSLKVIKTWARVGRGRWVGYGMGRGSTPSCSHPIMIMLKIMVIMMVILWCRWWWRLRYCAIPGDIEGVGNGAEHLEQKRFPVQSKNQKGDVWRFPNSAIAMSRFLVGFCRVPPKLIMNPQKWSFITKK